MFVLFWVCLGMHWKKNTAYQYDVQQKLQAELLNPS